MTTDREQVRALRDERTDIERRLARAQEDLKTAERRRDEPGRVRAAQSIEHKQARLEDVERTLADGTVPDARTDGPCAVCKTPFRNGRVDRTAVARVISEDTDQRATLAALERELRYTRETVALEGHFAELAEVRGNGREALDHRERVDHATKRIPEIEGAIAQAKGALQTTGASLGKRRVKARV